TNSTLIGRSSLSRPVSAGRRHRRLRALETGRGGLLILSIACVGTSFHLKRVAALVPVLEPTERTLRHAPRPVGRHKPCRTWRLGKARRRHLRGNKTCPQTGATWFRQR